MIEKVTMYSAICNGCGDWMELMGEYSALADYQSVHEHASEDYEWALICNSDDIYCPACHVKEWNEQMDALLVYTPNDVHGAGVLLGETLN